MGVYHPLLRAFNLYALFWRGKGRLDQLAGVWAGIFPHYVPAFGDCKISVYILSGKRVPQTPELAKFFYHRYFKCGACAFACAAKGFGRCADFLYDIYGNALYRNIQ